MELTSENYIMIESICSKCGEIYNPESWNDEHWYQEDGSICNGKPTMGMTRGMR